MEGIGGTGEGAEKAAEDSWPKMIDFFKEGAWGHLKARYSCIHSSGGLLLPWAIFINIGRRLSPKIWRALKNSIQDAWLDLSGEYRVVSKRMQFVEIDSQGIAHSAGYAPYLDYRPASEEERKAIEPLLKETRFCQDLEDRAFSYAVEDLVPQHLGEVKQRREELIAKTMDAVKDRLTKEINYWDRRANELKEQELAGKVNARINSAKARQRADDLEARLQKRMAEREQERRLSPLPPVVIGGALVVPRGFVEMATGTTKSVSDDQLARAEIEQIAMNAVMEAERALGYEPVDVSAENRGYDIESKIPGDGRLRFIEVKGRAAGSDTVTITRNEILTGLNKPEDFILAVVEVNGEMARPWYIQRPFGKEPDFGAESVNYALEDLIHRAAQPR